ncbi:MAG TPA: EAL domain-containing protein, partial [Candidatus Acidoferrales bacterium]|nr:EAL domain-containing protein [Candidatus Acidoferrales bacterium]
ARRVAALGARIALDDVSRADGLSRAVALEIDELKISRALIRRAVADTEAGLAARGLIEAARDLGVAVVAVGVEDTITSEWLVRAGCRLAQGYAVSLPLAATDVSPWRRWAARVTFGSISLAALGATPVAVFAPHAIAQTISSPGGATTCCSLQAPGAAHDTGFAMRQVVVDGMHVYIEASSGDDVVARVSAALARDVPTVQADLGASFEHAPDVYVFASRGSFALGLQNAFGQRATDAAALAAANGGVAFPSQSAIAINLVAADNDLSVVRHELTHVLAHQIAGATTDIPAWFDEGLATREQHTVAADPIRDARDESATLALLRTGSVSLRDLTSAGDWTMANAQLGGRGYAVAAEAVRIITHDLGADGVHSLLVRAHDVGFAQAFGEATGGSLEDFSNAFPARAAVLHGGPWIAQTAGHGQLTWSAAGFAADAPLHVAVDGQGYHLEFDARADHDGTYSAIFGGTVASGTYAVKVTSGTMRAETRLAV